MNKNYLWCNIDLFSKDQRVTFPDGRVKAVQLDSLPEALVTLCHSSNIYTVVLSGDKNYIEYVDEDIQFLEKEKYQHNKIKIIQGERK